MNSKQYTFPFKKKKVYIKAVFISLERCFPASIQLGTHLGVRIISNLNVTF